MYTLGIDIGSSSVKLSLLNVKTGECASSVTVPSSEMPIKAVQGGWAEQSPLMWWEYVVMGMSGLLRGIDSADIKAIGITYQMHGLVCLDAEGEPLRDSIIWCDSRAVEIGNRAFDALGHDFCLEHLLNSPGNFTASKLAWVKENEPEIYSRIKSFMLPGDYILYRLSGVRSTTMSGLSEQILWDFKDGSRADALADYYGIDHSIIPSAEPSIGIQAYVSDVAAGLLGLMAGTPISYRAGDQPNNAFSLNVLSPGEIAATGGTSGVLYGVVDRPVADTLSRVNTFLHVNHKLEHPRYGVLLCINATGILNAWVRRTMSSVLNYDQINDMCCDVPAGSDGVLVLPFGNGAERILQNRYTGAVISGVDLNRHSNKHILRAAQEGIAFAFRYGMDIMRGCGIDAGVIRAGHANLMLSPIFRTTLATICNVDIELYNTDGALGAARGAALGAGLYTNRDEAFASLKCIASEKPDPKIREVLEERYGQWCEELDMQLKRK